MAIGVPSYRYVTNSNRLSAEVNALLGDLQLARSEAIKEGLSVTVCPANTAATACAGTVHWHHGWIVMGNNRAGQTVMRVQQRFTNPKDTFVSDNNVTSISFNRDGFASTQPALAAGAATMKLTTLPDNHQWTRCVEVVVGGSAKTERYGQGNCT